jgi:cell fate regulator YaaT (PSP1 superfamily)
MKLVRAEYNFDGSRLTFYFTADGRVDFRSLVRDLAATFRTRIELRQIGSRDQAKLVGGLGRCGRELCCSAWLHDLPSTSIRMAKDQELPINPTRITGSCGRLLCCLTFEHDAYATAKRALPRLGQTVSVPAGEGRVVALHALERRYEVELTGGQRVSMELPDPCAACEHCDSSALAGATDTAGTT